MIRDLPYKRDRAIGFEVITLASLYERGARGALGHALEMPQRPEFHTIYVGTKGRGRMMIDFRPVELGAGRISIVARGRVQAFEPKPGVDAWMILFTPELVELPVLAPIDAIELGSEHATIVDTVMQIAAEQAAEPDRYASEIAAALVRSIVLRCERAFGTDRPNAHLVRFFTILERDFHRTRSVAHYAKESGLSARRLAELLHAQLGKSTKQIIDERVVLEHKRMLAHTELSVKELAAATGFDEPTNLVKFFAKHAGMTPLEFRRNVPSRRRS